MSEQRLHQDRDAAGLEHVLGDVAATRLQVGDVGRTLEDLGHVEEVELDADLVGHGRQVQRRVGRTTGGGDDGGGVLERLQGDDVARTDVSGEQFHHHLAGGHAKPVADLVRRGRAGRIGQSQPDRFGDGRHRVGRELRAAGAGRGAGDALELVEILARHVADRMLADRLEEVLHRDLLAAEIARQDRAAVDEDRGHVEAQHRHHHAGQRLVAAGEADERVVAVAAHGEFDRVGDEVARDERGLHALVTHGDAVGHGDRAKLARCARRRGDALLDRLRLPHQRDVAGGGLVPAGGDADERLVDLLLRQAHRVEIRAVRGTRGPLRDVAARQGLLIVNARVHTLDRS